MKIDCSAVPLRYPRWELSPQRSVSTGTKRFSPSHIVSPDCAFEALQVPSFPLSSLLVSEVTRIKAISQSGKSRNYHSCSSNVEEVGLPTRSTLGKVLK